MTQAGPGQPSQFLGPDFGQTEQQKQQRGRERQTGARASRANPFVVAVNAAAVVLFDQNLDQKFTRAGLGQALGWPRSSPGLGQDQALGKVAQKIGWPPQVSTRKNARKSDQGRFGGQLENVRKCFRP